MIAKKRGYYNNKKFGHGGNFALRASESVVNFFSGRKSNKTKIVYVI